MRLALILLLTVCGLARGADLLVLIPAQDAGPAVPLANYSHPTWILWPKAASADQANRLLSLPSGVDWQLLAPITYRLEGKKYLWNSMSAWTEAGFEEAVRRHIVDRKLYAYADKSGQAQKTTLLAASGPSIPILTLSDAWPEDAIVVATLTGRNPWDEKARLARKARGRVMVVELPDSPDAMWTRFWIDGNGWDDGVPTFPSSRIPGLVRARELLTVWIDPPFPKWGQALTEPPNRWLDYGHQTSPVVLVFLGVVAIYIIGLGIYLTLREIMSRAELILLRLLILGPAALVLGGELTASGTINQWPIWHLVSLMGLLFVASLANQLRRRWDALHPLWGEFMVGLATVALCDPAWSMFSHVLGPHRAPISPEAFGALAAYVVGARVLWQLKPGTQLVVGSITVGLAIHLLVGIGGWGKPTSLGFLPLLAVIYAAPAVRNLNIWVPFMIVVGALSALLYPGLAYAPAGLVRNISQVGKFNCAEQIAFLMSPTFVCFCLVAIVVWIAGDKFLGHQFRRAMAFSPQPRAFFPIAICFGVAGVFIPLYLHAALATVIAGGVAVLFDAIRAP